jgi:hypothetical protein
VDVRSKEFFFGKVETAATGTGVLIASDELDDLRMCDRVLVMFQGRVTSEIARGRHDHDLVAAMEREWTCMPETMPEPVLADTAAAKSLEPQAKRTALFGGRIPLARLRDLALVPAIVVIAIVGQIVNPNFLQADNVINVLQTMSEIALLVLAETMSRSSRRWTSRWSPPWASRPVSRPG